MTAEFESLAGMLLIILSITCIVQVIFVGLLLWYVKRMAESLAGARAGAVPSPTGAGEGVPATVPPAEEAMVPASPVPVGVAAPPAPGTEILGDSPDIQESIRRLCKKYALSDFIISTLDGLVVVSLSPGSSEDAARFSDLYRRKRRPDSPGVSFLEVFHRGEAMLAIARSDLAPGPDRLREIGEDARKILEWWL
ncbi:MAG: hypothetical protein ACM3X8_07545 [Methanomicrobiales archaeon]